MKPWLLTLILCSGLLAAPPVQTGKPARAKTPPNPDADLKALDDVYLAMVDRGAREMSRVRLQAFERRLEGYRAALKAATKAGDFDKATKIKARILELEAIPPGAKASKPKLTVEFKGRRYALIRERATWHTAQRKCDEMGGRLACLDGPEELTFLRRLCGNDPAWLGASNEDSLDTWRWITKEPATATGWTINDPDRQFFSKGLAFWPESNSLNDHDLGAHIFYVCEWDS